MPFSKDPEQQKRQLAALQSPQRGTEAWERQHAGLMRGAESPGTIRPGEQRALKHGQRSGHPELSPFWDTAVDLAADWLEPRVHYQLRDEDGHLLPEAEPGVYSLANAVVDVQEAMRWVRERERRGLLTRADLALRMDASRALDRAMHQHGMTLPARLEMAERAQRIDLAQTWAAEHRAEAAEARAEAAERALAALRDGEAS